MRAAAAAVAALVVACAPKPAEPLPPPHEPARVAFERVPLPIFRGSPRPAVDVSQWIPDVRTTAGSGAGSAAPHDAELVALLATARRLDGASAAACADATRGLR